MRPIWRRSCIKAVVVTKANLGSVQHTFCTPFADIDRSLRVSRSKFSNNRLIPAGYQADSCKTPPVDTA